MTKSIEIKTNKPNGTEPNRMEQSNAKTKGAVKNKKKHLNKYRTTYSTLVQANNEQGLYNITITQTEY